MTIKFKLINVNAIRRDFNIKLTVLMPDNSLVSNYDIKVKKVDAVNLQFLVMFFSGICIACMTFMAYKILF